MKALGQSVMFLWELVRIAPALLDGSAFSGSKGEVFAAGLVMSHDMHLYQVCLAKKWMRCRLRQTKSIIDVNGNCAS